MNLRLSCLQLWCHLIWHSITQLQVLHATPKRFGWPSQVHHHPFLRIALLYILTQKIPSFGELWETTQSSPFPVGAAIVLQYWGRTNVFPRAVPCSKEIRRAAKETQAFHWGRSGVSSQQHPASSHKTHSAEKNEVSVPEWKPAYGSNENQKFAFPPLNGDVAFPLLSFSPNPSSKSRCVLRQVWGQSNDTKILDDFLKYQN